jgi:xanthine dehydrogenase/oxidase
VFVLNESPVVIDDPDPTMLLVDYLRSPEVGLMGTKLVCGEGGCGSCTVLLARADPVTGAVVERSVNACLHALCSLDGAAVTTVEAVGSTRAGLNATQDFLVTYAGTQCGFCTPGWVMSMEGLLRSGEPLTAETIESRFDGNLCRCTGMRPILDAMQVFAVGPAPLPFPPPSVAAPRALAFSGSGCDWHRVLTLAEARSILFAHGATSETAKVLNGNTSIAYDGRPQPQLVVDVSAVPDLLVNIIGEDGLAVGGGLSLAELDELLAAAETQLQPSQTAGIASLRETLLRVANVQVRGVGTVAGNLMVTRQQATTTPFPSDLATALATLGATVTIAPSDPSQSGQTLPLLELPDFDSMAGGYVLLGVQLPLTQQQEFVKTYKVARRIQNAHALVNAGFRVRFDDANIADAAVVLGGIASLPLPVDVAPLLGQPWNWNTWQLLETAIADAVAGNLVPMPESGVSDAYRAALATDLAYKFFVWLALRVNLAILPPEAASAGIDYVRPVSGGSVGLTSAPNEWPSGEPIGTLSGDIQTTGEAVYTQDRRHLAGTVHAAYVIGRQLHATFDWSPLGGLDGAVAAVRARFPGVLDLVTVADVRGQNLIGLGGDDPIFADGTFTAYGRPLALVLANTSATAHAATAWLQENAVAYTPLGAITTIDEALALQPPSLFADESFNVHIPVIVRPGSDQSWLDDPQPETGSGFVTGTQRTGTQAHFYFETQSMIAIPGERDAMTLIASTQDPASCQSAIASALDVHASEVTVHVLRVGGGFGGKETRPPMFAAAAAVAAAKVRRPVRLVLDRHTDMAMIGGRHPYLGTYWASYASDGTIEKLRLDYVSNGGDSYDVTFPVSDLVVLSADGSYMVDTFGVLAECCRTNRMTSTAMRSFGAIQGSMVLEDAIEQVAFALGQLPEDVREKNLYADSDAVATQSTPFGQPLKYAAGQAVWKKLRTDCDFDARAAAVQQFNAQNRWRKRGISMIPIKYGVSYTYLTGNQGGALLTVCETDGTVVMATGGVEIGQGLATKLVQIAATALDIDMQLIQPTTTSTDVVPNASSTGASTGTDLNGGAVKMAANELKTRLVIYCEEHESEPCFPDWRTDWNAAWQDVVRRAYADRVDLSAQALYASPDLSEVAGGSTNVSPFYYFSYSAACSEVEIDVLTGECTVLRTDILYDAGQSLNPLLDAGQIWGGFVQGLGNVTTEEMYYADDGRPITDGTWNYKPPCTKTIPVELNVALLDYVKTNPITDLPLDPYGIQSSKSTGEPPLVLANTVFFAIKHAILAARNDAGVIGWFELESPATVERIQQACRVVSPGPV